MGIPRRRLIGAVIRPEYETWTHLMAMRSLWKIWVEAKSEDKALRESSGSEASSVERQWIRTSSLIEDRGLPGDFLGGTQERGVERLRGGTDRTGAEGRSRVDSQRGDPR